jgi:hypothetical protein
MLQARLNGLNQDLAPYDSESPLAADLARRVFEYAQVNEFETGFDAPRSIRSRVRYLAALFPDLSLPTLTKQIAGVVNNSGLSNADVRLVLEGRQLGDPTKRTREVPIQKLQVVGSCLRKGDSKADAARTAGVSLDTVEAVDAYLGITEQRHQSLVAAAVNAVEDGLSVRKFSNKVGVPSSSAHRLLVKARSVLRELGQEVQGE